MPGSNGELLHGQEYLKDQNLTIPFTQRQHSNESADALVGQARTDINPTDGNASLVRVYGSAVVSGVFLRFVGSVSFSLPNELISLTSTYNTGTGTGQDLREIGGFRSEGPSGGFSMNPIARAQGSSSVQPDLIVNIKQFWTQNVPCEHIVFHLNGNATMTQVIAELQTIMAKAATSIVAGLVTVSSAHELSVNQPFQFTALVGAAGGVATGVTYYVKTVPLSTTFTYSATPGGAALAGHSATSGTLAPLVQAMPVFKPEAHTFTCKGQQVQLTQNAETLFQYRWTPDTTNYIIAPAGGSISSGFSRDVGTTIRTKEIGPTVHGALTITNPFVDVITATVVRANTPEVTGLQGAPSFPAVINAPAPILFAIRGEITPTSLSATVPANVPTAGLYIVDMNGSPHAFGTTRILVTLVDFSRFA